MNYAQAVSSGRAPKPAPTSPVQEKKAEVQPEPSSPQPRPASSQTQASPPVEPQEHRTYEGNKGGPIFGVLKSEGINFLANALTPSAHVALGCTCKYLFTTLLNQHTWNLTQAHKIPKPAKPYVRLEVRVPIRKDDEGEEAGFSSDDVESEGLVPEGNSVLVYSSFFRKETRKQQLVKVWHNQASKIQKSRDKQFEEENRSPTDVMSTGSSKKPPLSMKFAGGFALSYREAPQRGKGGEKPLEKKEEFIARGTDLSEVALWLDGILKLIHGEKRAQFNVAVGGQVILCRYGRGGNHVTVKVSGKNSNVIATFALSDFAVQIRSAAKEFMPILGRVTLLINQDSKNIAGKDEAEAYVEFEKYFSSAMKQEKLLNSITKIKHSLERGVIPHSNIQQLLQKKTRKKETTATSSGERKFEYFGIYLREFACGCRRSEKTSR